MKRLALILIALGSVLILAGALVPVISHSSASAPSDTAWPLEIIDDLERTVTIAETPQRIVSLTPSITEILFSLGLGDNVVGVTDRCDYPTEAMDKPKVGGYFSTSLEAIIAQDPDVVFTDGHDPVGDQLDGLGQTMVVLQPQDIAGIYRDIEVVGQITDKELAAEELIAEMESRIDAVTSKTEGVERPTVFYVIDASDSSQPWTVGPGSFIDTLIALAGGENMVTVSKPYLQISLEEIVASDPDMIIGPASHGTSFLPDFGNLPVWKELSAVKEGKIYFVEDDLVSRSGPRIVEGLEEMAKIIHPALFP